MTSATRCLVAATLALACALTMRLSPPALAQDQSDASLPRIWRGAYSAAQAERGKATFETSCSGCHGADLTGGRGPALAGTPFRTKWNNEAVIRLLRLVMETMPRGDPGSLSEETAADVIAYMLSVNAFPAGSAELNGARLPDDLIIVGKVPVTSVIANFTHVQAVGCLTGGPEETWILQRAGQLSAAKEESVSAAELGAAKAVRPGDLTMRLVNPRRFKAKLQTGQLVYVKGLVNRTPRETTLNLTALEPVGGTCTP